MEPESRDGCDAVAVDALIGVAVDNVFVAAVLVVIFFNNSIDNNNRINRNSITLTPTPKLHPQATPVHLHMWISNESWFREIDVKIKAKFVRLTLVKRLWNYCYYLMNSAKSY